MTPRVQLRFDASAAFPDVIQLRRLCLDLAREEPRSDEAGDRAEHTDAGHHEDDRDEASFGGYRIDVTVRHSGHGRYRPPHRIVRGLDVASRRNLELQNHDARDHEE